MPISISDHILEITTPFLRRKIELSSGPATSEIYICPPGADAERPLHHLNGGLPLEAAVKIDGQWLFCGRDGTFRVTGCHKKTGKLGEQAIVHTIAEKIGLEADIIYEVSETVPLLHKMVRVRNISNRDIMLENIAVEVMYPGLAGRMLHFMDDFRLETRGEGRLSFGLLDFLFPDDIDWTLAPGEEVESFRFYEYFSTETEGDYTISTNRVLKLLAPWALTASETSFQVSGVEPDPKHPGIASFFPMLDACSNAGLEKVIFFFGQLFTNTGDYQLRRDFFPGGEDDLHRLVQAIHDRGMRAGIYASYAIAWRESEICREHDDWQCRDAAGNTFDPGACGNMCFLSGWGDYIKGQFRRLMDAGFDEFQLDGPTDIPCTCTDHEHGGPGNYQYRNWLWERELFALFRKQGVSFTIPRFDCSFLLLGAAAVPGGYLEEDFCHTEGRQLLNNYRASICAGRRKIPGWCTWGFLAVGNYHGHRILADEDHPDIYEHGLASLFGYGQMRSISGAVPCFGPVTAAILADWVAWVKCNRPILQGDFIPLRAPDGKSVEAVFFAEQAKRQGVLILLNPTAETKHIQLLLPLKRLGLSAADSIEYGEQKLEMDDEGFALVTEELAPLEVKRRKIGKNV